MEKQQRDLRVAILIQSSEGCHSAPRAVAAEPGAPQVADHTGELPQRQRRCVDLQAVHPCGSQGWPLITSGKTSSSRTYEYSQSSLRASGNHWSLLSIRVPPHDSIGW